MIKRDNVWCTHRMKENWGKSMKKREKFVKERGRE